MNDLLQKVIDIVDSIPYINIASVSQDGQPWNTPVYAVRDEKLHLYWRSWTQSQHSKNIQENGNVFITIYDSTNELGKNYQKCVYLQGVASEVSEKKHIESLLKQFKNSEESAEEFFDNGIKRIYQFIPQKVWLNSVSERELTEQTKSMRVEVEINTL